MSSNSSKSSSRQKSFVDPAQGPFLEDLYRRAQGLSNAPLRYYPESTVADETKNTLTGRRLGRRRALAGSSDIEGSRRLNTDLLEGKYLNPESNRFVRATFDSAADAVTDRFQRAVIPGIESRFARAGQSRSSGYENARVRAYDELGSELGDLATSIYGRNFDIERARQTEAADRAFDFADEDYRDIDYLRGIGADEYDFLQRRLDDDVARFNFGQNEPTRRIQTYAELLGGPTVLGQGSSSSKPVTRFDPGQALSGLGSLLLL